MPGNPEDRCVKKPSWVAGWRTIRPTTCGIRHGFCLVRGRGMPGGVARTTSTASSAATALTPAAAPKAVDQPATASRATKGRSEEHTSELQSRGHLACRLLLE